jgi:transposase
VIFVLLNIVYFKRKKLLYDQETIVFCEIIVYIFYMLKQHSLRTNISDAPGLMKTACAHFKSSVAVLVISSWLKVALSTVYSWRAAYFQNGYKATERQKRGRKIGSGRILTLYEEAKVQCCIINSQPTDYGLNYSAWTRRAIAELVYILFKKQVAVRTIGDYLKRWEFTPQRPVKKAYQQDSEKVREWVEETYPSIEERVREEGAVIFWGDEAGIHSDSFNNKSYAPKGQTPVLITTGTRLTRNIIVAISNLGIVRYMTYLFSMNCRVFIAFLNQLIKSSQGTKVFLIVDNLKVHHGKMVQAFLEQHKNEIELFFLPPYSPELNPEEYFNHLIKQRLHALPQPKDKDEFNQILRSNLRSLQKSPELIQSLFLNENIQYASA